MVVEQSDKKHIGRRQFLKGSAALGAAVCLESLLGGCATLQFKEEKNTAFPPLPAEKIQPPEYGCLIGFHNPYQGPSYYESFLNISPAIMTTFSYDSITSAPALMLPSIFVDKKAIPLLFEGTGNANLADIIKGKHDRIIELNAKNLTQDGTKYGGFFINTMWEMNGYWFPWGQNSAFKKAWKHIWQIFEDNGTNRYATWVWEVYCPEVDPNIHDPDIYYAGDKYIDWIGLSAFNRNMFPNTNLSYDTLTYRTYKQMRINHPTKPIMQSEFGKTSLEDQVKWVKDAYRTIKARPGMKAAVYFDGVSAGPGAATARFDDKTLRPDTLQEIKTILKDRYFIKSHNI
jgi:hypothetical protein